MTVKIEKQIERDAVISENQLYRYRLSRWWDRRKACVTFLMLNPSTADATVDDHTIRKCIGFAERWGFGGIEVVNLFAWRSTDANVLVERLSGGYITDELIGPEFLKHLYDAIERAAVLIVAWGCENILKKRAALALRPGIVLRSIRTLRPELPIECLGMSKTGNPYHPLMLAYDTPRIPYAPEAPVP